MVSPGWFQRERRTVLPITVRRYFGGRWAWLQRSSVTPSKVKEHTVLPQEYKRHDPESGHPVDGRWSGRASMIQPRRKKQSTLRTRPLLRSCGEKGTGQISAFPTLP